jgi:hypothetical protein
LDPFFDFRLSDSGVILESHEISFCRSTTLNSAMESINSSSEHHLVISVEDGGVCKMGVAGVTTMSGTTFRWASELSTLVSMLKDLHYSGCTNIHISKARGRLLFFLSSSLLTTSIVAIRKQRISPLFPRPLHFLTPTKKSLLFKGDEF